MNTNDIQITLPPSKSLTLRWLILNYLHGHPYHLRNLSTCDDARILRDLLGQMPQGDNHRFYCGASGTVARCMMALLAATPGEHLLTGDSRLSQRPMAELIDALNGMGFEVRSTDREGFLPVQIRGGVPRRKMAYVDPSRSSQFVSALMLVAPELPEGMSLMMTRRPSSRPYIEMTRQLLESLGVEVSLSSNGRNYIIGRRPATKQRAITMEADWSAVAPFMTVAAMCPGQRLRLKGLEMPSLQGDSVIVDLFAPLGVVARRVRSPYKGRPSSVTVEATTEPTRLYRASFTDCPDLFPAVAVACAVLGVNARLRGIANLKYKESDRTAVVQELLTAMGCRITCNDKEMHLYPSQLHALPSLPTFDDHRIAMAFAPLLLRFPEMQIEQPEVVSKSFPDFWNQFAHLRRAIAPKS